MSALLRVSLGVLLTALVALPAAHADAVISTFDTDLESWIVTGDNAMSWNSTGGNPGGCLSVNDLAIGDVNKAVAPERFLGDWSLFGATDTLALDLYSHLISGTTWIPPWTIRISGPGGAAHWSGAYPADGVWTHYAVTLSSSNWVLESGTWAGLLASVQTLMINGEYVTGPEDCRLDNVRLSRAPGEQFFPCLATTFNGADTEDWAFSGTTAVTFSASGGTAGGYVRVSDGAAVARAIAPPSFRGDWSSLDGTGSFHVDIRSVSAAGSATGAADFVTLSGPGGVARHAMTAAEVPPPGPYWKSFDIPLDAASWVVTGGTWQDVLFDVENVTLTLDFYSGDEVVGLDNVARLEAGCARPDQRIVLNDPQMQLCGITSMESIRNVAVDPVTGRLFGVINDTPGALGGLWALSGPQAGTKRQAYDNPAHLIFDSQGNAYVSEDFGGNVYRYAAGGGSSLWVSGFHADDDDPFGFCFAPPGFDGPNVDPGDLLVTDRGFNGPDEVWAFSTAVPENERLVGPDPGEIDVFDLAPGNGVVYMADYLRSTALLVLSPTGTYSDLTLQSSIGSPSSIVRDPNANVLYVANNAGKTVHRVNPATGAVQLVASGFLTLEPCCLELDAAKGVLWITDKGANRVYRVCLPYTLAADPSSAPGRMIQLRATPNPARGAQRIAFSLPSAQRAELAIFDLAGRQVRTLADREFPAGEHEVVWDGRDDSGSAVRGGLFIVRTRLREGAREAKVVRLP